MIQEKINPSTESTGNIYLCEADCESCQSAVRAATAHLFLGWTQTARAPSAGSSPQSAQRSTGKGVSTRGGMEQGCRSLAFGAERVMTVPRNVPGWQLRTQRCIKERKPTSPAASNGNE